MSLPDQYGRLYFTGAFLSATLDDRFQSQSFIENIVHNQYRSTLQIQPWTPKPDHLATGGFADIATHMNIVQLMQEPEPTL